MQSVSAPSVVLPRRRGAARRKESSATEDAFGAAWALLEEDVADALRELRAPALREVAAAVAVRPRPGEVVAVCVLMGAAAVAGDRAEAFDAVVEGVKAAHRVDIVRLDAAYHSGVAVAALKLEECREGRPVVVAIEDADAFPEDTLRDVVYLCGKIAQDAQTGAGGLNRSAPPVSIVFGLSTSVAPIHSALGVLEATMIVPVSVSMPSSRECFKVIVERVLSSRRHSILFSRDVFEMIDREFRVRDSTTSMLLRCLHLAYSMHFFDNPLASVFAHPRFMGENWCLNSESDPSVTAKRREEFLKALTPELRVLLRDSVMSVSNSFAKESGRVDTDAMEPSGGPPEPMAYTLPPLTNPTPTPARIPSRIDKGPDVAFARNAQNAFTCVQSQEAASTPLLSSDDHDVVDEHAFEWHQGLMRWRVLCSVIEQLVYKLLSDESLFLSECKDILKCRQVDTRMQVFRVFLEDGRSHLREKPFISVIRQSLKKASEVRMLAVINGISEFLGKSVACTDSAIVSCLSILSSVKSQVQEQREKRVAQPEQGPQQCVPDKGVGTHEKLPEQITARGGSAARSKRQKLLRASTVQESAKNFLTEPRQRLLDAFDQIIGLVVPVTSLPMYETMFFNEKSMLQKYSGGMGGAAEPRSSLFTAMRHSSTQLGSKNGRSDPDTAVAYRILAEGGRLVNLYDWYNSFCAVVSQCDADTSAIDEEGNAPMTETFSDVQLQARFAQVCSELEFLGVLKYTNRKTDHVARLVYE